MDSGPGDAGSSPDELPRAALDAALERLVVECRAWLLQVERHLDDLSSLHDDRTARVVEALGLTMAEPATPGTLRHLEHAASGLLRSLNEIVLAVPPPRHLRRRRRRS
jgi:hypothetical protein